MRVAEIPATKISRGALRLARSMIDGFRPVWVISFALLIVSMTVSAHAEEISPLRKDKGFASRVLHTMQLLPEMSYRVPGLPAHHAFNAIASEVVGVNSLARFGLSQNSVDAVALTQFARAAIENRLFELQVSNDIAIKTPSASDIRQVDCELLRLDFLVEGSEVEVAGRRVIVVVVDLWAWQDARLRSSDGKEPCIDSTPPLMRRDARRTFAVEVGQREKALQQLHEQIISIIDTAVLLRVAVTNKAALETVHSWAKGAN